jgi:hypothetical protein
MQNQNNKTQKKQEKYNARNAKKASLRSVINIVMNNSEKAKNIIVYIPDKCAMNFCISEIPTSAAPSEKLGDLLNNFIYHYAEAKKNKAIVQKCGLIALELGTRSANTETLKGKNLLVIAQVVQSYGIFVRSAVGVLSISDEEMEACLDADGEVNNDLIDSMLNQKAIAV